MGNLAFVRFAKNVTPDQLHADIVEIVSRRLKNKIRIEHMKHSEKPVKGEYGYEWWHVWVFYYGESSVFNLAMTNGRNIEAKHGRGDFWWWAQMVIFDELAYKHNGTCSDEGVQEKWKMTKEKLDRYAHYKDWIASSLDRVKQRDETLYNTLFQLKMSEEMPELVER